MITYYLFNKETKNFKITNDPIDYSNWLNQEDRFLAADRIGDFLISTVALGANHGLPDEPLEIFETMVQDTKKGDFVEVVFSKCRSCIFKNSLQERYATYDEAIEGHRKVCRIAIKEINTGKGF